MTRQRRIRLVKMLWHSRNGGRTWETCDVYEGSPLYGLTPADGAYDDGMGNLYRATKPEPVA